MRDGIARVGDHDVGVVPVAALAVPVGAVGVGVEAVVGGRLGVPRLFGAVGWQLVVEAPPRQQRVELTPVDPVYVGTTPLPAERSRGPPPIL